MNEYLLDPNVCPSSLGEDDEPVDPANTAHVWDDATCSECGETRQETKCICAGCGNEHMSYKD